MDILGYREKCMIATAVLYRVGRRVLSDILYCYIPPSDIKSAVEESPFFRDKPITSYDVKTLEKVSATADYSAFDVAFLYSLFRHCTVTSDALCPTSGWGQIVSPNDIKLEDDIERIHHLLNYVPSQADLESFYKTFCAICERLDTIHDDNLRNVPHRPRTYSMLLAGMII